MPTTNEANSASIYYPTQKAFDLGLEYNFYQHKNFNFKAAFIWRPYNLKNSSFLKKEDTGQKRDAGGNYTIGPYEQFKIPILAEYTIPLSNKLSASLLLGPELIIYPNDDGYGSSLFETKDKIEIGYREIDKSQEKTISIGLNTGVSINLKTKPVLIKTNLIFHYQPEPLYTVTATMQNLLQSPNTISKHTIKGNYLLFGFTIIPSKTIFKKKTASAN